MSAIATENREPLVITARSAFWRMVDLGEFWHYRELLYFLVWRDMKIRYKQAVLGVAWAVVQPLFAMLTFTLFFGKLAKIPSDSIPYPVFSFAAMLPWSYFTTALGRGSNSLVSSGSLFSKVYFPRVTIPFSAVLAGLVDYAISFVIFVGVMLYYGFWPSPAWLLAVPLLTTMVVGLAFGMSLWLSALNVKYRDVSHVLPFLIQLWMFATPVVYPLSMIPEKYRWLERLNPMTGIIEGFRTALLARAWDWNSLIFSLSVTVVLVGSGLVYFGKTEATFADII